VDGIKVSSSSHALITGELRVKLPKCDIHDDGVFITTASSDGPNTSSNNAASGPSRQSSNSNSPSKSSSSGGAGLKVTLGKATVQMSGDNKVKIITPSAHAATGVDEGRVKTVTVPSGHGGEHSTVRIISSPGGQGEINKVRIVSVPADAGRRKVVTDTDAGKLKIVSDQPTVRIVDIGAGDHGKTKVSLSDGEDNDPKTCVQASPDQSSNVTVTDDVHGKTASTGVSPTSSRTGLLSISGEAKILKVVSGGEQNKVKIVAVPTAVDNAHKTKQAAASSAQSEHVLSDVAKTENETAEKSLNETGEAVTRTELNRVESYPPKASATDNDPS
jgi:hypothetical protein